MSDDLAWQEEALCAQTDPEIFFPDKGQPAASAKRVCAACDVQAQCLAYALTTDVLGVWGGLSRRERQRLQADNKMAA